MAKKIVAIEGIGPKYAEALSVASVVTTEQLLSAGSSKAGRKALAEKSGISEALILKWVNMADLFRIKGVAGQFAELLHAAGVDTVKEMRTRNGENLAKKMAEVNAEMKLTRAVPSTKVVDRWIEQASQLPPVITH